MELRVLGAHNAESKTTRLESHLIDKVLVLDAGGLTRSLTFEEQAGIRAVILSHRHFDHVRDLLPLGVGLLTAGKTIDVYAIEDTVKFVSEKLLDGSLYPDFRIFPSPEAPVFRFHTIEFYREFQVLGYNVMAVPVYHAVPAAGFQIRSGNTTLFYPGDTGKGLSQAWPHVDPNVMLTEVTFGNGDPDRAAVAGHLTPNLLEETLSDFKELKGYIPKIIVAHMNPAWEATVRRELAEVQRRLGFELQISEADMVLNI